MDVTTFWAWAITYEPSLSAVTINPVPAIITNAYNYASNNLVNLAIHMDEYSYEILVYNFALHKLIVSAKNSTITQLTALYTSYGIASFAGIIQSAGDGPSSASKMIPRGMQDGSAGTLLLWATPYGKEVEAVFEELKNIAITA